MKKTCFYIAVLFLCSTQLFAQKEASSSVLRPTKVESTYKFDYKTEYLLEEAELKACFKNGLIPTNFPKVSDSGNEETYRIQVGYYVNENPHLFNADEAKKYGYTVVEKPVPSGDEYEMYKRKEPLSDEEMRIQKEKHPKQ